MGFPIKDFCKIDLKTLKWKDVLLSKIPGGCAINARFIKEYENISEDGELEEFYGHKMCVATH